MCFGGSFLVGERKTHKQNPPQILGQSRETLVYRERGNRNHALAKAILRLHNASKKGF